MHNSNWLEQLDISPGDHVIAIVTDDCDLDLLPAYYGPALDESQPCIAVATPGIATELQDCFVGEQTAQSADTLSVLDPSQLGDEGGKFSVEKFLEEVGACIQEKVDAGAKFIRHAGVMRWLDEVEATDEDRIYLEAKVNQAIEGTCVSGFCVYNSRYISGHLLVQLLRTHPKVLHEGSVIHNPFYEAPEKVIKELGR